MNASRASSSSARRATRGRLLIFGGGSPYADPAATRSDLREATTTLEDLERTTRRVLGGAHPLVRAIERNLQEARDALYARGLP